MPARLIPPSPRIHATSRRRRGSAPIAFHTLRAASPAGSGADTLVGPLDPTDPTKGQFWLSTQDYNYTAYVRVSTLVGQYNQPSLSMRSHFMHESYTFNFNALSLYADRDISALKGVGFRNGTSFDLAGIFDGAYHATLKDQNDFRVMEHGTCVGLIGSTACRPTSCFNYCWDTWPCAAKPAECP